VDASADSAEEINDTTGASPWSFMQKDLSNAPRIVNGRRPKVVVQFDFNAASM